MLHSQFHYIEKCILVFWVMGGRSYRGGDSGSETPHSWNIPLLGEVRGVRG